MVYNFMTKFLPSVVFVKLCTFLNPLKVPPFINMFCHAFRTSNFERFKGLVLLFVFYWICTDRKNINNGLSSVVLDPCTFQYLIYQYSAWVWRKDMGVTFIDWKLFMVIFSRMEHVTLPEQMREWGRLVIHKAFWLSSMLF